MNVGIVGGGILGMHLAKLCRQAGHAVTLFEAEPELGGLLRSIDVAGVVLDRFYHVILPTDTLLLDLIAELGLSDQVQWKTTRTGFYANGALHSLNNLWQFLRFKPLNLYERLRLGLCVLMTGRIQDWRTLEAVTAADWFVKLAGTRVAEKIWHPLLQAKFADYWDQVNAAYMWGTINRVHGARKGTAQQEALGCIRGGYAPFLEAMRACLDTLGTDVRTETAVRDVIPTTSGRLVVKGQTAGGEACQFTFDKVVSTLPQNVFHRLLKGKLDTAAEFDTLGIIEGLLLLKKPLSPYYVINITDRSIPFTGILEYTNVADPEDYQGLSVVFISRYIDSRSHEFGVPDREIKPFYLENMKKMFPTYDFDRDVHAFEIMRTRYLQPVQGLHYSQKVPDIQTPIQNLYAANTIHITPWPVFTNETLKLSRDVFETYLD